MQELIDFINNQLKYRWKNKDEFKKWAPYAIGKKELFTFNDFVLIKVLPEIKEDKSKLILPERYKEEEKLSKFNMYVMGIKYMPYKYDMPKLVLFSPSGNVHITDNMVLVYKQNIYLEINLDLLTVLND